MSFLGELQDRMVAILIGWIAALFCLIGGVKAIVSKHTGLVPGRWLLPRGLGFGPTLEGSPAVVYGVGILGLAVFLNLWFVWSDRRISVERRNVLRRLPELFSRPVFATGGISALVHGQCELLGGAAALHQRTGRLQPNGLPLQLSGRRHRLLPGA